MGIEFIKTLILAQALISIATCAELSKRSSLSCEDFTFEDSGFLSPPKILVSSAPGSLRLDEDNSTYVVEAIGAEIRIDCWAPYPINIEFNGHLSNRDATVSVIERSAKDYRDPSTFCFSINITVNSFEQITGEYTCFSVLNQTRRTSSYIYHAAHPQETLLNRGQSVFVEMKRDEDWLIFPCASSNPHVPVQLFKREGSENVQLQVDGVTLKYDPKAGFMIWKPLINPSVSVSVFQCKTDLSVNDRVDIAVLPPTEAIATPAVPALVLKEGDVLKVTCESAEEIVIDNTNDRIEGKASGRPRNGERNLPYVLNYQTGILRAGDSGIISCRTKANNTVIHEWTFNVLAKPVSSNDNGSSKPTPPVLQGLNPFLCKIPGRPTQLAIHACSNWVECNLRKCRVQDRTCESNECENSKTSTCVPNGVIQCFNAYNQSVQTQIYFSGLRNKHMYTLWKAAPNEDILKIRKIRLDKQIVLNEGNETIENVEVICEGSSFVFAVGFKWFLVSGNEETPWEIPEENVQHKWRNLNSKHIIRSVARMNISRNTQRIICKAPIWNSTEWIKDFISVSNIFEEFKKHESSHQNASHTNTTSSSNSILHWKTASASIISYIRTCIYLILLSVVNAS